MPRCSWYHFRTRLACRRRRAADSGSRIDPLPPRPAACALRRCAARALAHKPTIRLPNAAALILLAGCFIRGGNLAGVVAA